METNEPELFQLNEIYYNCIECSSTIEIISIKDNYIEYKCINNNHERKILLKEYIEKMKKYNNKNNNNDECNIHNNKYECYCIECNKHLCNECLKLREHIGHNKINIIEIKPNEKEINIMKNIIKYYDNKINELEIEKYNKTKDINNKLKEYKNKLNEKNELKIKENENNMKKELKLNEDKYDRDIKNIKYKYENELKLINLNMNKIKMK